MKKQPVIAVAGPTASGKSDLALSLAKKYRGEIVCMDSMQVYRGMNIGTAKPSAEERAEVPHHLFDILDPNDTFSVADYAERCNLVLSEITSRGFLPILVGGTGLYLRAVMHGMSLGNTDSNEELREELKEEAKKPGGIEKLHARLYALDPDTAERLHPNDLRRVIRAIEVCETSGKRMSEQAFLSDNDSFSVLPITISWPREELYARIERRVRIMIGQGLLEEVRGLLSLGVQPLSQSMQAIGYKELIPVILEGADLQTAVCEVILHTRHYAKRQETWMRTEPKTCWIPNGETLFETACACIDSFLSEH